MGTISENKWAFTSPGGLQFGVVAPAVVASVTALPAPLAYIEHVSGTVAITTIALPWPGFTGSIILIPDGVFTTTTAGTSDGTNQAIALASTAVVSKAMIMTYDGTKWYPSY